MAVLPVREVAAVVKAAKRVQQAKQLRHQKLLPAPNRTKTKFRFDAPRKLDVNVVAVLVLKHRTKKQALETSASTTSP